MEWRTRSRAAGARAVLAVPLLVGLLFGMPFQVLRAAPAYPWPRAQEGHGNLAERIPAPPGFHRLPAASGSFAAWLRGLPLRPAGSRVHLFDGRERASQAGVFAVLDVDVGRRDLQQCADAVLRLRAEYLYAQGWHERIVFRFTSGEAARWTAWRAGWRPVVSGSRVEWRQQAAADSSYVTFRAYLDAVFMYAGSYSLARELEPVADPSTVMPGDVFVQGGFPGHAVLVADVAVNARGERRFLLVQSYMPAQDLHVLVNPLDPATPWYPARRHGTLVTPDWRFSYTDLRRFVAPVCTAGEAGGRLEQDHSFCR